jgi:hypothetical protein
MTPEEKQHVLDEFTPKPPYEYLTPAWFGGLSWAIGSPEVMERFRSDTGSKWSPPRSVLGKMIDEATGADVAFIRQFAGWFNENIWGDPGAPLEEED